MQAKSLEFNLSADGTASNCVISLPVKSIGHILLPSGQIKVENTSVQISAIPDWLYDQHVVLEGVLIRCKLSQNGSQVVLRGLTYFKSGDYLSNLSQKHTTESVEIMDGSILTGKIVSVSNSSLSLEAPDSRRLTIALSEVENIYSSFSFWIEIPVSNTPGGTTGPPSYQASSAAFASTKEIEKAARLFLHFSEPTVKQPKSTLLGTEGGITKPAIASMIAADAANTIAPLVALPLTMTLGQRRAHNTINGYTNSNRLNDFVLHMPTTTPPTAMF